MILFQRRKILCSPWLPEVFHPYHQTPSFLPWDALPGLLQLLLVCGSFCRQLYLKCIKSRPKHSGWDQVTGHWRILHFFAVFTGCFGSLSISTEKRRTISFFQHLDESEQIVKPWTPHNSSRSFYQLWHHQWTPVALQVHSAIAAQCRSTASTMLTRCLLWIRLRSFPSLHFTCLFPSFRYKLILVSSSKRTFV